MTEFLSQFGALSLGGAMAVLLLWATTFFPRTRYAARWRCWGWLLLCLRLAVPVSLPAFAWIQAHSPIRVQFSEQVLYQPQPNHPPVSSVPDASLSADVSQGIPDGSAAVDPSPIPAAQTEPGSPPSADVFQDVPSGSAVPAAAPSSVPAAQREESPVLPALTVSGLLSVLWLTGAVVILIWSLVRHARFLRYLRRWATPVTEEETLCLFWQLGEQMGVKRLPRLMVCEGLPAPMLAGIFRSYLLLPMKQMGDAALRHSLLHELSHFRRRDIPFKTLALWVTVLHWFNPAVWLMARAVNRDIELACDDAVLRRLPPDERAAYGKTILQSTQGDAVL